MQMVWYWVVVEALVLYDAVFSDPWTISNTKKKKKKNDKGKN